MVGSEVKMSTRDPNKVKIYSRVLRSVDADIGKMAKEFSMTKSSMIALCVKIGMNYLKAMADPEGLLTPEYMASVLAEAEKGGIEFKVPVELRE
jgi:microsomal dipeptidase-like Zn-dependent dipeptidase